MQNAATRSTPIPARPAQPSPTRHPAAAGSLLPHPAGAWARPCPPTQPSSCATPVACRRPGHGLSACRRPGHGLPVHLGRCPGTPGRRRAPATGVRVRIGHGRKRLAMGEAWTGQLRAQVRPCSFPAGCRASRQEPKGPAPSPFSEPRSAISPSFQPGPSPSCPRGPLRSSALPPRDPAIPNMGFSTLRARWARRRPRLSPPPPPHVRAPAVGRTPPTRRGSMSTPNMCGADHQVARGPRSILRDTHPYAFDLEMKSSNAAVRILCFSRVGFDPACPFCDAHEALLFAREFSAATLLSGRSARRSRVHVHAN
ncbi:hypothetical protein WOLCODRAFT_149342 [Wolfiporia cocos MD-104 SS10]|uniref:Uncharacterized protein n=1 Tax=Wolfiporia cocos (strain MD-104) TaxID=742152 RepID=A0A2H3JF25_WOLCO|nr:hypothetical protein WOLCODRAFT_149342 [Wolfiporia cocos MD-104 SS10]